jgi:hypothetical protein
MKTLYQSRLGFIPALALAGTAFAQVPNTNDTSTTATATAKGTSDAAEKKLRAQGFKPELQNGKTVYCRRETRIGSHFESKSCTTLDQILRAQQAGKDALDQMQRTERGPAVGAENGPTNR